MFSITAQVLELSSYNHELFLEQIKEIRVARFNQLVYTFQDGHEVEATWQDRARKSSWSEEAKQKARERALASQRGDLR